MLESITIQLENCEDIYKSKNSKNNIKKYVRKLLENLSEEDYLDTLNNHETDFRKYFKENLQINFKIEKTNLTIFLKKLTNREINKIKLKNKLTNNENKNNFSANKKEALKKFELEKKSLKADTRVNPFMTQLYYKVKYEMPDTDIPTPIEILNNMEKYKILFTNYIKSANEKLDLERYILLKSDYTIYMSFMTEIIVNIPEDLETRYKTNNMKF